MRSYEVKQILSRRFLVRVGKIYAIHTDAICRKSEIKTASLSDAAIKGKYYFQGTGATKWHLHMHLVMMAPAFVNGECKNY